MYPVFFYSRIGERVKGAILIYVFVEFAKEH